MNDHDGPLLSPEEAPRVCDDADDDDRRTLQRRGVRLLSHQQLERGVRCDRARIVARICRRDAELLVCRLETSIDGEDRRVRVLLVELRVTRTRPRLLALPASSLDGLIDALERVTDIAPSPPPPEEP